MKGSSEPIRAAIYARVSTDQQAEANTIASQVEALEERLGRDGLPLEKELRFIDDGCSGSTLVRPALERLRDAAAEGAIDRLYVHSPDRLARSYAYQVLLVDELRRCGVELVFLNRPLGCSPEDDLLLQVQGVIAEYERAKILERSRRGKLHAAGRGSVSVLAAAPYGYRYVTKLEGGGAARYDVVLEQARVVRQVFEWVGQERCSIGEVCRRLHQRGIPSPGGMARWDRKTVWAMLRNPAYQGTARFGKSRSGPYRPKLRPQRGKAEHPRRPRSVGPSEGPGVPIAVPALIDEDLFATVAGQLEENRRRSRLTRRGARYLLQGLLVCKQCGYALYGKPISPAQSRGKRRYTYYRCIGTDGYRFGGQKACSNKSIRTEILDEAVWQDVCGLLKDPERVAKEYRRRLDGEGRRGDDRGSEALEPLIGKVRRGIARLIDAYGEGLLEKEEFEPRIRAARERLARLQAEAEEQADIATRERELRLVIGQFEEFAGRVGSGLEEADWATRRAIVRALVSRVEVDGEAVRIVYRVGPCPFAEGPAGGLMQGCGGGVELDLRVAIGLVDGQGRLAEVVEMAQLMGHAVEGLLHRVADRGLAVGDHPDDRHRQRLLDLLDQPRQVVLTGRQQAFGQQHFAAEDVAQDPEDLVADVRLQAVDGQDDLAGLLGDPAQPGGIGAGQGQQLVVAVQQVADATRADRHAAADQLGVDLREAAVLGVAEDADRGDDVEPELVLGQDHPALLLGPQGDTEASAVAVAAAADLQPEADQPVEGGDGASGLVGGPQRGPALGAGARQGREVDVAGRFRPGGPSGHRSAPGRLRPRRNR
jgi:site-specific DNA recombinase